MLTKNCEFVCVKVQTMGSINSARNFTKLQYSPSIDIKQWRRIEIAILIICLEVLEVLKDRSPTIIFR